MSQKNEDNDLKKIDGYDTAIVLSVKRRASTGFRGYLETINIDVIGEVGWLKDGELRRRLNKLCELGYLVYFAEKKDPRYEEESWGITEKGKDLIKWDPIIPNFNTY